MVINMYYIYLCYCRSWVCHEPSKNGIFSTTGITIFVLFALLDIFFICSICYKRTHKDKFMNNSTLRLIYRIFIIFMIILNIVVFLFVLFVVIFIVSWATGHHD